MNIFVLNRNPRLAAQDHCDRHVVKMIIESAQLMSFVHHLNGSTVRNMCAFSETHAKHPCTLWAATSIENYEWLYELAVALSAEYTERYGKVHKTYRERIVHLRKPPAIKQRAMTPHVQCMPEYLHHANVVTAYRDFYLMEKGFAHYNYRHSPRPLWLIERLADWNRIKCLSTKRLSFSPTKKPRQRT